MDRPGLLQTGGVRDGLVDYQKFLQITDDGVERSFQFPTFQFHAGNFLNGQRLAAAIG
jgi:hypothetical protein